MAYTHTWNTSFEGTPSDSDDASEGAMRIRYLKIAIRERLAKDHYMDTSGTDADHGEHDKVTFREQSSSPTEEADKGYLFTKEVSGKAELFWRDEDGNEIQLTSGGVLSLTDATNVTATDSEINTVADGAYAKNIHDHSNFDIIAGRAISISGTFAFTNRTTLASNASSGDGTIEVADSTGYGNGDSIRIYLNSGSYDDTTVSGVSSSTISLNDNLTGDADSGNNVMEPAFPTIAITNGIRVSDLETGLLQVINESSNVNEVTTTGSTWSNAVSFRVYVPSNPSKLYLSARIKSGYSTTTAYARLEYGGSTGGTLSNGSDSYAWKDGSTGLDMSGIGGGWKTVNVQLRNSASGVDSYIQGLSVIQAS